MSFLRPLALALGLTVAFTTFRAHANEIPLAEDNATPSLPVDPLEPTPPPESTGESSDDNDSSTEESMMEAGRKLAWVVAEAEKKYRGQKGVQQVEARTCNERGHYDEREDDRFACIVVITASLADRDRLAKANGGNPHRMQGVYVTFITRAR